MTREERTHAEAHGYRLAILDVIDFLEEGNVPEHLQEPILSAIDRLKSWVRSTQKITARVRR